MSFCRYDKDGHAVEGQSLTELKGGSGGGSTNWKTLSDVKNEHLGHGEKVLLEYSQSKELNKQNQRFPSGAALKVAGQISPLMPAMNQ